MVSHEVAHHIVALQVAPRTPRPPRRCERYNPKSVRLSTAWIRCSRRAPGMRSSAAQVVGGHELRAALIAVDLDDLGEFLPDDAALTCGLPRCRGSPR